MSTNIQVILGGSSNMESGQGRYASVLWEVWGYDKDKEGGESARLTWP